MGRIWEEKIRKDSVISCLVVKMIANSMILVHFVCFHNDAPEA